MSSSSMDHHDAVPVVVAIMSLEKDHRDHILPRGSSPLQFYELPPTKMELQDSS